ncbi:hypothetical protein C8R45DRAFT_297271 [Mycena sanguinolenta]|nr:hypothetical protein C8R45DRAFT_297271 [Mycena sanguinolenta]
MLPVVLVAVLLLWRRQWLELAPRGTGRARQSERESTENDSRVRDPGYDLSPMLYRCPRRREIENGGHQMHPPLPLIRHSAPYSSPRPRVPCSRPLRLPLQTKKNLSVGTTRRCRSHRLRQR